MRSRNGDLRQDGAKLPLIPSGDPARMNAASAQVEEIGPQKFSLTVLFDGQRFDCGTYISRAEALKAGRLFIERKEGEQSGRQKRGRKK